ncbi:hypothetical protein BIV57_04985 [Mangrovactinospora gilvigrisea]|uniref:Cell envelope-related transcriptional attenuator domain-containing protein n=1 Tax=Mangrovactinospora gilvigrisea TaxID=1428644 RepID=A0A1J7BYR3_9ACTN|nr:LCP family protein [Mangrovactinospora gilvigrisea]OIV38609.1 hypothetical protein BIV57_04985 [Mangrovactinospora gilvigrisea]
MTNPQEPGQEPPLPPELSPRRQAEARGAKRRDRRSRRWRWPRRIVKTLLVLVVVLVLIGIGTLVWAQTQLQHVDALADYSGRPAAGAGTNWLLVGSDSRDNLTAEQKQQYHTGSDQGRRTDTIIVLHTGSDGTTLVSIPRDSWVTIPAYQGTAAHQSKINSAFGQGGAPLLVRTVETATGLRMDHYAEIGFAGFVNIVDALGGVHICLTAPVKDSKSGADLPVGCQTLDGQQALAFVRARYFDPTSDFGRMKRQQQFLSALADRFLSADVLLNPFRIYPAMNAVFEALLLSDGTGLLDLARLATALNSVSKGDGKELTVPISTGSYPTPDGEAVLWNKQEAATLFEQLRQH